MIQKGDKCSAYVGFQIDFPVTFSMLCGCRRSWLLEPTGLETSSWQTVFYIYTGWAKSPTAPFRSRIWARMEGMVTNVLEVTHPSVCKQALHTYQLRCFYVWDLFHFQHSATSLFAQVHRDFLLILQHVHCSCHYCALVSWSTGSVNLTHRVFVLWLSRRLRFVAFVARS